MGRVGGRIDIVAVGRLKEAFAREAQALYLKRLRHYSEVRIIEVKDWVGRGADAAAAEREGEELLEASKTARRRVLLHSEGRGCDSVAFSRWLRERLDEYSAVALLIGGPVGFSEAVLEAAPEKISLSPMTLTHELARVVLLEQLYRAMTLINGEAYHK